MGCLLVVALKLALDIAVTFLGAAREGVPVRHRCLLPLLAKLRHFLAHLIHIHRCSGRLYLDDILAELIAFPDLLLIIKGLFAHRVHTDLNKPPELLPPIHLSGLLGSIQLAIAALRQRKVGVEMDDHSFFVPMAAIEPKQGPGVTAHGIFFVIEGADDEELLCKIRVYHAQN